MARNTSPEDSSDVLVVVPVVDQDRTNGVEHNDSVLAEACNMADDFLTTLPQGKVVAVALIAVDDDVTFSGVGIGKD